MQRWIVKMIGALALMMAVFHLYAGGVQLFPATQQRAIHLGLALALVFLLYPFKKGSPSAKPMPQISNLLLAAIALGSGIYIFSQFMKLAVSLNSPSVMTMIVGALLIVLTLEASRRILGWSLPIIALVFLLYAFVGENLPLMVAHSGFSLERIVTQIGISNQGILGIPLGVSATYIVLFIIYGSLLERSGAGQMFIDLAMALVGRFRGGAAKVSVVASALFGTISGSQVANVATTGVLTIPLMKKGGYKPEYAGAVEAVASTGGMFLPPVMGAVSFLIADFLQVDYAQVVLAAAIPALLYFFAVFVMVDLRAAQFDRHVSSPLNVPDMKRVLKDKGHLLLPLFVLIFLLLIVQWSPPMAAFWSILSIPLASYLRKETRMKWKDIAEALQQGVKLSLMVAAATACAGIVIGVINMTGMGLRFSGLLIELSGGSLLLLLILTMIASIVMGMGLPPVASYIVLAILAAPAMTNLGVPPMAAHLFIFYYGTLSAITPPVAFAAYAASGIANANPMKIGFVSVRLALVAFIIPFMFVYGPSLILQGSALSILLSTATAFVGVYALAAALEGFMKQRIRLLSRVLMLAGALLLIHVGIVTDLIGLFMIGLAFLIERRKS